MAHHIYHTKGVILGSVAIGESNRFYKIFTEELGLIGATAQSVREERSKLRYALQDYAWIDLDVVRGREVWRITSAIEDTSKSFVRLGEKERAVFAHTAKLVLRLVHGEGKDEVLFNEFLKLRRFLEFAGSDLALVEVLVTLRIFARLGYVVLEKYPESILQGGYEEGILADFQEHYLEKARIDINNALRESHL